MVSKSFGEVVNFPHLSIHLYITIIVHLQAPSEPREGDCFHYLQIPTYIALQPLSGGIRDRSIIVLTMVGILDGVISKAGEVVIRQGVSLRLALQEAGHGAHPICSLTASSTTNVRERQDAIVYTHAEELVRCICGVVAILCWVVLRAVLGNGSWIR
jgi:hypothetical protein